MSFWTWNIEIFNKKRKDIDTWYESRVVALHKLDSTNLESIDDVIDLWKTGFPNSKTYHKRDRYNLVSFSGDQDEKARIAFPIGSFYSGNWRESHRVRVECLVTIDMDPYGRWVKNHASVRYIFMDKNMPRHIVVFETLPAEDGINWHETDSFSFISYSRGNVSEKWRWDDFEDAHDEELTFESFEREIRNRSAFRSVIQKYSDVIGYMLPGVWSDFQEFMLFEDLQTNGLLHFRFPPQKRSSVVIPPNSLRNAIYDTKLDPRDMYYINKNMQRPQGKVLHVYGPKTLRKILETSGKSPFTRHPITHKNIRRLDPFSRNTSVRTLGNRVAGIIAKRTSKQLAAAAVTNAALRVALQKERDTRLKKRKEAQGKNAHPPKKQRK